MAVDDPATWDAAPVDPALWRAMDELSRLYEQATPGPWLVDEAETAAGNSHVYVDTADEDGLLIAETWNVAFPVSQPVANTRLIVALYAHAPALIAAVRRLAGRNLDLEATVAQQGVALEATESARLALQQALGDLLRSCEHVAQVTDDPVYDAVQDIWSASLTTEDERRMRRAALAEGSSDDA